MASRLSGPGRYWLNMVAVLTARPGGFLNAVKWLVMYASARILAVRRIVRRLSRDRPLPFVPVSGSIFEADIVAIAESLHRNGFDTSLRLPAETVEELFVLGQGVSASTPNSVSEPSSLAPMEKIAQDPTVLKLGALYLGCSPIYQGSRVWWTRPGEIADPTETGSRFHYDLYDYRAVVFLIYLTDVDQHTGSHVCVRGSHWLRSWSDQIHPRRHRSDDEIIDSYGAARIVTISGPAGMVIAEDPFCFHKVMLPIQGERLAAQLLYTGRDFPVPSFIRGEPAGQGG